MRKITGITNGAQVVSEEGSMIHEDSLLRTIGHTMVVLRKIRWDIKILNVTSVNSSTAGG
jgi:hypothetical protein